jgi:hypothetical protein
MSTSLLLVFLTVCILIGLAIKLVIILLTKWRSVFSPDLPRGLGPGLYVAVSVLLIFDPRRLWRCHLFREFVLALSCLHVVRK